LAGTADFSVPASCDPQPAWESRPATMNMREIAASNGGRGIA
jgi:hypothetical protein